MCDATSGRGLAAGMAALIALGSGCAGSQVGAATNETRDSARQPFPIVLTARPAWTEDIRAARVRVWADQAYRAQNPRWKEDLDDYVAYAKARATAELEQLRRDYRARFGIALTD